MEQISTQKNYTYKRRFMEQSYIYFINILTLRLMWVVFVLQDIPSKGLYWVAGAVNVLIEYI